MTDIDAQISAAKQHDTDRITVNIQFPKNTPDSTVNAVTHAITSAMNELNLHLERLSE